MLFFLCRHVVSLMHMLFFYATMLFLLGRNVVSLNPPFCISYAAMLFPTGVFLWLVSSSYYFVSQR